MLSFARVRALAIVTVLIIVALVITYRALERDESLPSKEAGCPEGFVPADLTLHEAGDIKINVINATGTGGMAERIGENFANREFQVLERENTTEDEVENEIALLRYGPEAVGSAHVLQAYFLNRAVSQFDIERDGDVVDVVIGPRFQQLATETEVRQAIAGSGNAEPPAGTCAGEPEDFADNEDEDEDEA